MRINSFLFVLIFFIYINTNAQFNEYFPDYEWLTIKGEKVVVHYHPEAERTAKVVAKIADEVWGPITSLYEYEPETVHFVIKDIDDFSNGATYFFDNKIEIWASALDFDLRGSHNWLRNVISHEFTHMVQIQAGMKFGRSIPAFYVQYLNYEDKRRPDILYGFPNFIASYPIAGINVPAWLAEGTAQYMRKEFDYDDWDTHRDMILRSYALDDNLLTWNQMGVFNKTSLGNESVYNSGFALTRYIAQKYGEDKLREVSKKLGEMSVFTVSSAFKDILGKDGNEIYDEWSGYLKADYNKRTAAVKENLVQGTLIRDEGFGNFYPTFSKDEKKIVYISNKNEDYFGLSSIFLYDFETKKEKMLESLVRSTVSFVNDDDKIVYAKLTEENKNNINIHDLYIYDINDDESTRLTFGLRANHPTVSHDGKKIAFVFQKDGTQNLGVVDIDGKNFKALTIFANGELIFNPSFSPDNNKIIFDYSYHHGRDLAVVNADGSDFKYILNTASDERNAVFASDNRIIYADDETGIFNLYEFDLTTQIKKRITNVTGGAFYPDINDKGDIVYAGYTSKGYKIFSITKEEQSEVDETKSYTWQKNPPLDMEKPNGDINNFDIARLKNFNDYETPDYKPSKYSGAFSKLSFFPFIRFDDYNLSNSLIDNLKPGVYVTSNDFLNRYSIFAGAAINTRLERDLFLLFEYRNKLPLIYDLGLKPEMSIELYSISRKADADIFFGVDSTFNPPRYEHKLSTGVGYNLFEFDLAAKHKIFAQGNNLEFRFVYSSYTSTIESFTLPDGNNTLYPTTKDNYFIGRNFRIKYENKTIIPNIDSDINPLGREVSLQYDYEFNEFNPNSEYEVVDGILKPLYEDFNFHKLELNWKEYYEVVKGHTLTTQLRAATIFGPQLPDFFDFYLGGLLGMKSYPFYSISGNELAWLNLTYRFPLFRNIDARFGHLYIDKIYMSVYGDIGNAWNGEIPEFNNFKKGAGAEIRVKINSFYLFPTSIFFNAAYSFDEFTREVIGEKITYGKEWLFYGGILFDFQF
ncbi:MAG: biopolymer transporter Tol [Bacteroidetes bacterium]|nr:biopolymer transporter Tol [Bacteroidota bacterium]